MKTHSVKLFFRQDITGHEAATEHLKESISYQATYIYNTYY